MSVTMMKKRMIAFCLCVAGVLLMCAPASAAGQVDLMQTGTLTFVTGGGNLDQENLEDLCGPAAVYAWRLAEISGNGSYTVTDDFSGLTLRDDAWDEVQEKALAMVYGGEDLSVEPVLPATRTGTLSEGLKELPLGLYLIVIDPARSAKYEYTFRPMIVSLPWTEYRMGGSGSDAWQYTLQAALKASRTPRYGDLGITKTLTSYNASMGDATFVFEIEGTDEDGEIVYSNVVSATFSAAGRQKVTVTHIPAGTCVTVTEVYSGANCSVTVSDNEPQLIVAEEEAQVSFTNAYDEEAKSGYGVENRFRYDTGQETYVWTTDRTDIHTGTAQEVTE